MSSREGEDIVKRVFGCRLFKDIKTVLHDAADNTRLTASLNLRLQTLKPYILAFASKNAGSKGGDSDGQLRDICAILDRLYIRVVSKAAYSRYTGIFENVSPERQLVFRNTCNLQTTLPYGFIVFGGGNIFQFLRFRNEFCSEEWIAALHKEIEYQIRPDYTAIVRKYVADRFGFETDADSTSIAELPRRHDEYLLGHDFHELNLSVKDESLLYFDGKEEHFRNLISDSPFRRYSRSYPFESSPD